ncbi:hypothetical protein PanWU01x14_110340 [Parasponia andersonii]|uniref:Uncharacterized protein n=1 Tax=Parasponia andersonii TaxID=3476 RepID=A0A2P5CZA3_PARAD|nr:hypothetical protein PanWU01x14_110340 [Parasponia andersonii]
MVKIQGVAHTISESWFIPGVSNTKFLHKLWPETRLWVERGNGTSTIYQLSIDEAYWLLEDMADVDYQSWSYLASHLSLEDNSKISALCCDIPSHQEEPFSQL